MSRRIESLNIELLYIFIKVSDLKSINKSSEVLALTQPAISKKIMKLEDYFDIKLFERSSKGMTLTIKGEKFYIQAKKVIDTFQDLKEFSSDDFGDLNIGTLDSVSSAVYPDFFVDNMTNFHKVIITNKINELIQLFNQNKLDVLLMDSSFSKELNNYFYETKLLEEPYILVHSKNNKLVSDVKDLSSISLTEIQRLNLILYPKYCPIHQNILRIYRQTGLKIPKIIEIDYGESTVSLVGNSDYVTILPESLAVNKVTQDSNLAMKQLDTTFIRSISLFTKNKENLDFINRKLAVSNDQAESKSIPY